MVKGMRFVYATVAHCHFPNQQRLQRRRRWWWWRRCWWRRRQYNYYADTRIIFFYNIDNNQHFVIGTCTLPHTVALSNMQHVCFLLRCWAQKKKKQKKVYRLSMDRKNRYGKCTAYNAHTRIFTPVLLAVVVKAHSREQINRRDSVNWKRFSLF